MHLNENYGLFTKRDIFLREYLENNWRYVKENNVGFTEHSE
jgi:hypothetical protein